MKKIDLLQATDEWKAWRDTKLGASDAATVMGLSPYSNPHKLWSQKVGLSPPTVINGAMRRGQDLEESARQRFCNQIGKDYTPAVYESTESGYEFMAASLDGIADDGSILEIKCNGKKWHAMVMEGKVPPHHECQLQHQLFVCKAQIAYYYSYDGFEGIAIEVVRDNAFIEHLKKKEKKFWWHVENLELLGNNQ